MAAIVWVPDNGLRYAEWYHTLCLMIIVESNKLPSSNTQSHNCFDAGEKGKITIEV